MPQRDWNPLMEGDLVTELSMEATMHSGVGNSQCERPGSNCLKIVYFVANIRLTPQLLPRWLSGYSAFREIGMSRARIRKTGPHTP